MTANCAGPVTPVPATQAAAANEWQPLFDGQSLDGWTANENKDSCKGGRRRDRRRWRRAKPSVLLRSRSAITTFKNFQLKLKVKAEPKANSGVYFHTKFQDEGWPEKGYEAQVNNSGDDPRKTGSLYGVKDVDGRRSPKTTSGSTI